jgi:hypothetical protein
LREGLREGDVVGLLGFLEGDMLGLLGFRDGEYEGFLDGFLDGFLVGDAEIVNVVQQAHITLRKEEQEDTKLDEFKVFHIVPLLPDKEDVKPKQSSPVAKPDADNAPLQKVVSLSLNTLP